LYKLLFEKGADVNAQGGKYGNALQAASIEAMRPWCKAADREGGRCKCTGRKVWKCTAGSIKWRP
jgi:hypothetical protein